MLARLKREACGAPRACPYTALESSKSSLELDDPPRDPIDIPHTQLSASALRGVLESFVLRDGTDYGQVEFSLEQKVQHVLRQLERGEAKIVFDPRDNSVDIVVVRK